MNGFVVPAGTIVKIGGIPFRLRDEITMEGCTPVEMVLVDGVYVAKEQNGQR